MSYRLNSDEIVKMRESGHIVKLALDEVEKYVRPGVTTSELDAIVEDVILSHGGRPACKGYEGFPAATCVSVDDVVVHGIPSPIETVKDGSIVGIDITVEKNGYYGDAARTFCCGNVSEAKKRLIAVTQECFFKGLSFAKEHMHIGDIGFAVQVYAQSHGCGVVRDLCGHGIGKHMHEPPEVPNYGKPKTGYELVRGNCICIEPMITLGGWRVTIDKDGWTVRTIDGSCSAHYENTVLITDGEPELLTV